MAFRVGGIGYQTFTGFPIGEESGARKETRTPNGCLTCNTNTIICMTLLGTAAEYGSVSRRQSVRLVSQGLLTMRRRKKRVCGILDWYGHLNVSKKPKMNRVLHGCNLLAIGNTMSLTARVPAVRLGIV